MMITLSWTGRLRESHLPKAAQPETDQTSETKTWATKYRLVRYSNVHLGAGGGAAAVGAPRFICWRTVVLRWILAACSAGSN